MDLILRYLSFRNQLCFELFYRWSNPVGKSEKLEAEWGRRDQSGCPHDLGHRIMRDLLLLSSDGNGPLR